jgi:hypothetical protein
VYKALTLSMTMHKAPQWHTRLCEEAGRCTSLEVVEGNEKIEPEEDAAEPAKLKPEP